MATRIMEAAARWPDLAQSLRMIYREKEGDPLVRILRTPTKYVQGPALLGTLGTWLEAFGKKAMIIISKGGYQRSSDTLIEGFRQSEIDSFFAFFSGKITEKEIEYLCTCGRTEKADMVVGIGGGKIIDTAKAVGYYNEVPIIIVPTAASTDAPCSALSILYNDQGEFDKYLFLKESPHLVLVDTDVVLQADPRLLVAGMGDALSTYYEARAVQRSGRDNQIHGKPTLAAFALAEKAKEILFRDGLVAKLSAEEKADTTAFRNIVEVNTYLSGVGFESGGLAAAHAIQKGLTHCPELDPVYHGEKVSFCLVTQLILENAPSEERDAVVDFLQSVGLPTTFETLGLTPATDERLMAVAENSMRDGMTIHNMPFEVNRAQIVGAMKAADACGRQRRQQRLRG